MYATKHTAIMTVHVQYNYGCTIEPKSLAYLRQCFNEVIDFCGGVVKMWGDPEAITARRGDNVLGHEVVIQRHVRQTIEMTNTNNL